MSVATLQHLANMCKTKQFDQALALACSLEHQGIHIPRDTIYSLLRGYGSNKDPTCARRIHFLMMSSKLDRVPVLADHLIRLFVSCGSLEEAQSVFERVSKPTLYTWNAILTAHSKLGNIEAVFELFHQMQKSGLKPDRVTILCMLRACGNSGYSEKGRLVHEVIFRIHLECDLIVGSALLDMYSKCGKLEDARKIFDDLPGRDAVAWGAIIAGYAQHGDGLIALQLFNKMQMEGIIANEIVFSSVLKACGTAAMIEEGQVLHSQLFEAGLDKDLVIISSLVDMYSRNKSIEDAQRLFQNALYRDGVLWGTMVGGYALCGYDQSAIDTFTEMLLEGLAPSKPMLLCVIKAVSNLHTAAQGRVLNDLVIKIGIEQDLTLGNALIDMYAKCKALDEAQSVFNCMQKQDVVSWAALMAGYREQGNCKAVTELFLEMQENGLSPDRVVLLSTLKACAGSGNIDLGRNIHKQLDNWGLALDLVVSNALIDMYAKCRSLEEAHTIFNKLGSRDEVSWGAIISGYVDDGNGQAALELANKMLEEGKELGKVVLLSTMKACSSLLALPEGRLLHKEAIQSGLALDLDIGCTLISMYAKCGCLDDATRVFNALSKCDLVAWTSMILAHAEHGNGTAIELFAKMQEEGVNFNASILLCVVEACGGINDLIQGRVMHHQVLKHGLDSNASVTNLLIGMYAKCQNLKEARRVFDTFKHRDQMSWGTIISAYVHNGDDPLPLDLFSEFETVVFGREMLVCILKACGSTCSLQQGRVGHSIVVETGLEADIVIGSTLINMYAKCSSLHDTLNVFNHLQVHDLVTYSTMISALVEFDNLFAALELYTKLQCKGLKADKHVQQCILRVCGALNFIRQGRQIHDEIVRDQLDSDAEVQGALIDLYMNCSSLEEALKVFNASSNPDISLWGAIIAGYTHHGHGKQALQCIEDMDRRGVNPSVRMFSTTLAACSHAGDWEEGHRCFRSMTERFNIMPSVEHLNCMVDLFGRAGHLLLATDLMTAMPTSPDVVGWKAFLNASRMYGHEELVNKCFDQSDSLEQYGPSNDGILGSECMEDAESCKARRCSIAGLRHSQPGFHVMTALLLDSHVGRTVNPHTISMSDLLHNKGRLCLTAQSHECIEESMKDKDDVPLSIHEDMDNVNCNLRIRVKVPLTCSP